MVNPRKTQDKGGSPEMVELETISEDLISDTQKIRYFIVQGSNGEKKMAMQKFWRKSNKDPWLPGKGFHLNYEAVQLAIEALQKGSEIIE